MKRPTMRTIAKLAKVCPMTVSLALRNHAKISARTRARVQQCAQRLGYRPDPAVAKLMFYLRTRRGVHANLAALTGSGAISSYAQELLRGVVAGARRQGYALEVFRVSSPTPDRNLRRTMRNRGIEGVVICPKVPSEAFGDLLEWERFSVVATSYAWKAPLFTRVVPDGFGNTLAACSRLAGAGFRSIGLVLTRPLDEVVRHHFSAAVTWHGTDGGAATVPTLFFDRGRADADALLEWYDRHRPDVILAAVADHARYCRTCLLKAGRTPPIIVCLGEMEQPELPCILQQPELIGETAINLLAGMLQRGERGIPGQALTVQVPGLWRKGDLANLSPPCQ